MTDDEADLRKVVDLAIKLLPPQGHPTPEEINSNLELAFQAAVLQGLGFDKDAARRLLESRVNVTQDDSIAMSDGNKHVAWLDQARAERAWPFWERYERYLLDVLGRPIRVVHGIDQSTDRVLADLEDPLRPGPWQRRGLVIGQVQSGKTGQFIGLTTKAVDAGYRLIIVLAGVLDDLRAQTQWRIDEGLLGFDTQYQVRTQEGDHRIGVGTLVASDRLLIASLTTSQQQGDFGKKVATRANIPIGDHPVVLVIKKHPRIIKYVRTWMTGFNGEVHPETGERFVKGVPLLLIDDEADNASINTNISNEDPTAINREIRDLLRAFEKSAYVGYTATPYANVFIDPEVEHERLGSDLFPESFIHSLPAPSNYLGPERLFGLMSRSEDDDEGIDPLPLVRHVDDASTWVPEKHKAGFVITEDIPESLQTAINSFVLTCAARRTRGQLTEHNSMLVHVTRFTRVQKQVAEQIGEYLYLLKGDLSQRFGERAGAREAELERLWNSDFVATSNAFPAGEPEPMAWSAVREHLVAVLRKIQIKEVNGVAKDVLEYYENRESGLSVIAVGGQKLSRGLTLEGLSVSYYLRLSSTYDTLLQMGRWFGYRPGYEDLCRLWMTKRLEAAYREITRATDELRRDVEEMAVLNEKPTSYGLKVRASSLGLAITAPNKRRDGTRMRVSYQGELAETTIFPLRNNVPEKNVESLERFVELLDNGYQRDPETDAGLTWGGVTAEDVATGFFDRYITAREATRVKPGLIAKYIRKSAERGELGNWTVRVVSQKTGERHVATVGGHEVAVVTRRALETAINESSPRMTIKRVLSPRHEAIDLTREQRELALKQTKELAARKGGKSRRSGDPTIPTGRPLRSVRLPDQALLLIYPIEPPEGAAINAPFLVGFAASFPYSDFDQGVEYLVNSTWFEDGSVEEDEAEK